MAAGDLAVTHLSPALRTGCRLLAVLCCLALLASAVPAHGQAERASRAQAELEDIQSRIQSLRDELRGDRRRRDRLTRQLEDLERELGDTTRHLRQLEDQHASTSEELAELQRQREQRRAELEQDRADLAEHLRRAWITGRRGRLRMLLNQEDPGSVGRVLAYYDYLSQARSERIRELGQRLAELAELEQRIAGRRQTLAALRDEQRGVLDSLQATREERGQLLARIESRITERGQQIGQLEADEQRLQELIDALQARLADVPDELDRHRDFSQLRGQLPRPVQGRVIQRYGQSLRDGRLRSRGILFAAEEGSEIVAVSHGRVAFAEWLPNYGLVVIMEHGGGYLSLYGHTREVYRDVGEWVTPGEVIASVGDSGGRDSPALYFEIRADREPVDPAPWFGSGR